MIDTAVAGSCWGLPFVDLALHLSDTVCRSVGIMSPIQMGAKAGITGNYCTGALRRGGELCRLGLSSSTYTIKRVFVCERQCVCF